MREAGVEVACRRWRANSPEPFRPEVLPLTILDFQEASCSRRIQLRVLRQRPLLACAALHEFEFDPGAASSKINCPQ